MQTKSYTCDLCKESVSELAGFVKLGMNARRHVTCHEQAKIDEALRVHENALTAAFQRREKELLEEINKARQAQAPGAAPVIAKSDAPVFDTATWDQEAAKIAQLAVVHFGPVLPGGFKRIVWFIYEKMRDKGLIQPISDDTGADKPLTEKQLESKAELEAWLRGKREA